MPGPAGNAHGSYEFHVLTRTTLDDKIISLRLAPHIATNVRLPEAVNSVVVGSPECFAVEHSEGESQLVTIRPKKEETCESKRVRAGVSDVIDNGTQVVVLFSVLNPAHHAIEILPPQVQLGGKVKKKWTVGEQLPVSDYRLSAHRLGPQQRADGVAVFERPSFKQSNETLFLQIAESGAVDKPALAPIGFGISTIQGGSADVQR